MSAALLHRLGRRAPLLVLAVLSAALIALAALAPGTSSGFSAKVVNSTNRAASATYFTCAGAYSADKSAALFQYPLNETAGSRTALDVASGANRGTYYGSMTTTTQTGCPRDAGTAYVLDGSTSYVIASPQVANPQTFSIEVWFRTSLAQGKLVGFGNSQTGSSGQYDRHVYLTSGGVINFGIYSNGHRVLSSSPGFADGRWHHVVGTISSTTGMVLYVDGKAVAANATYTSPEPTTGWWHVGFDNLSGWPGTAAPYYFNGSMRYAAVYTGVLTSAQVWNHYNAGRSANG